MKILVTGAAGFVGRAVTRRLLERAGTHVRCLVRRKEQAERLLRLTEEFPDAHVECVVGDLLVKGDVRRAVTSVDTIYHLAAAKGGGYSEMVMNTVVGSRNLLEAIQEPSKTRVVLVSSFSVYGMADLPPGTRVDERMPLEPRPTERGAYSYSKLKQEELFSEVARKTSLRLAVVRPGVIYGPGGARFSPRVGLQLPGLFLHLGRSNSVPFTFVDNCADAIVTVGQHDASWGEIYNVVDVDGYTSAQYFRSYRREVGKIRYITLPYPITMFLSRCVQAYHRRSRGQLPAVFTPYKTRTLWVGRTFANDKLRSLGWEPRVGVGEGMSRTFECFRNEPRG
jgi:nucleoside-diphosphate-sugar epimerase